ncbi:MAG: hypothetical protein LBC20_16730 [Planctomycetaceae bacterium]|nr:hypothetical protein [Planctomycetaceae bacterium]
MKNYRMILTILFIVLYFGTIVVAQERLILLAVSEKADPAIKKAAMSLMNCPIFTALQACGGAADAQPVLTNSETLLSDTSFQQAAYNNLVIIGLPEQDILLQKCWGHQLGLRSGEIDVLGYGKWRGDFGIIESDRNPFLYSHRVKDHPYSTNIIKISGTSIAGVIQAVEAFRTGLLNGIVPAGQGQLVETSILDRKPDFVIPPPFPNELGEFYRIGWTQPNEIEYRAYIDLAGYQPERIWRIKYVKPKVFDNVSGESWVNGLHRLSYGNAVTVAVFVSTDEAKKTWNALGQSNGAKLETLDSFVCYRFEQPTDEAFDKSYGDIRYFVLKNHLIAVSLPQHQTLLLLKDYEPTVISAYSPTCPCLRTVIENTKPVVITNQPL